MCGRYDNLIAREAYRLLFRAERLPQSNFPPRYNIAPTDPIPIIRVDPRDGERELAMARWGLVPWLVEGDAEGPAHQCAGRDVHKTPLFREAFAKRRALIPATGFFEWQKRADGKQPYRFRREDLEPFAFAGPLGVLPHRRRAEILSAAIIVGEPNPLAAAIHDRMPVILDPGRLRPLARPGNADRRPARAAEALPGRADAAYAVSRAVNSVKNDIGMHRADRRAAAREV